MNLQRRLSLGRSVLGRSAALTRKSLAYVRKNVSFLRKDPRFFVMKTAARFEVARRRGHPAPEPSSLRVHTEALEVSASIDEVVHTLERDGYFVGLRLQHEVARALQMHALANVCYAERNADLPFHVSELAELECRLGRPIRNANYFEEQNEWPAFALLRDDPYLALLAQAYLGTSALYLRSELCWTFPGPRTEQQKIADAQVFHCDINDYRTLKLFFYLSDVGADDGPHEYIRRDPRGRKWLHQMMGQRVASLPEGELQRIYGGDRVVRVCGPGGLGFAGDPYTFHRGGCPRDRPRLLLQIEFGQTRYRTWYFEGEDGKRKAPKLLGSFGAL